MRIGVRIASFNCWCMCVCVSVMDVGGTEYYYLWNVVGASKSAISETSELLPAS